MAYRSDVPLESHLVRSAAGDLAAVRENFVVLDPLVQSGLNALISGGPARATGQVPVAQGGGNAQWQGMLPTVSGGFLRDVQAFTPVSGHVLRYFNTTSGWQGAPDGSVAPPYPLSDLSTAGASNGQVIKMAGGVWAPGTDLNTGGGGGGGVSMRMIHTTMASGQIHSTNNGAVVALSGLNTIKLNTGGFTVANGVVTVPAGSGYTHVEVRGQVSFAVGGTGFRTCYIRRNGVASWDDPSGADYALISNRAFNAGASAASLVQATSPIIPISGGETFSLASEHTQGVNLDVEGGPNGVYTWLEVIAHTLSG